MEKRDDEDGKKGGPEGHSKGRVLDTVMAEYTE
jgi:hypothetical protein